MKLLRFYCLMILTGCFLSAAPAYACKCMKSEMTEEAAAAFPHIFTAESRRAVTHVGEKYIETTILRVLDNFKGGASGDLMPLHYQGGCAFQFEDGKTYLVFAEIDGHIHLKASVCSPTRAIESRDNIPDFLRNPDDAPAPSEDVAQP